MTDYDQEIFERHAENHRQIRAAERARDMHDPRDDDNECPICGGEGFMFHCFDDCCEDADVGCDDCTQPCDCRH